MCGRFEVHVVYIYDFDNHFLYRNSSILTFCLFPNVDRINVSYDTCLCSGSRRRFDNVAEEKNVGWDTFHIGYHPFFGISLYCSDDESKEAIFIYCTIWRSLSHWRLACLGDLLNLHEVVDDVFYFTAADSTSFQTLLKMIWHLLFSH